MDQVKFVDDKPFKNLNGYGLLIISLQIFIGCLLQILPGPFLNTQPHMLLTKNRDETSYFSTASGSLATTLQ